MSVGFLKVNNRIAISKLGDDRYYSTVIQDVDEAVFNILVPYDKGMPLTLKSGEEVRVFVAGNNEGYEFTTGVMSKIPDKVPLYKLKTPDNMTRVQRREFVRLRIHQEIDCSKLPLPGGNLNFIKVMLVDISAGGLKLIYNDNISINDTLILSLNLKHKHTILDAKISGKVLRIEPTESSYGKYLLAVEFVDMTAAERDKISKFVFDKQVELRRAGQIGK